MNKVMKHIVLFVGKMPDCGYPIFLKAKFTDGRFSISGVEGPLKSGNCKGGCGQIRDSILDCRVEGDLTKDQLNKLHDIWEKWHLNDMQAGSPKQMEFLEQFDLQANGKSHYDNACNVLTLGGLNPDPNYLHEGEPYKYGSAWLTKEVPEDVIEWVFNLPPSSRHPNWI